MNKILLSMTVSLLIATTASANKPIDCSIVKDPAQKIKCEEQQKKLEEKKAEMKAKADLAKGNIAGKVEEKKAEVKKEEPVKTEEKK